MKDLLFAVPWWLPTLLAVIGIVLFLNGNKSQVVKVRNIGLGLVLLAIVWALVSYFVDTDKEKVEKGTRQLVQAVVDGDWSKFQSQLTPAAAVVLYDHRLKSNAADTTAYAKAGAEWVHLKSAHMQNLVIEEADKVITVHCDIFSTEEQIAPTETSTWQFEWEKTDQGWKLREIRLISLKGMAADQMPQGFPGGK